MNEQQSGRGWQARLQVRCAPRDEQTRLIEKSQLGPLTVQRAFYPEGAPCHLYLLHPPGGVVGGDALEIGVAVESGGHALITSPGATKYYRSAGEQARLQQRLQVEAGAVLEWLPQEAIVFPGARVSQSTEIQLSGDARFFGWELLSLGRPVIGERFTPGWLDSRLRLHKDGRLLLDERLRVQGDEALDGTSGLRGYPVSATLIATGATRDTLALARQWLAQTAQAHEAAPRISPPQRPGKEVGQPRSAQAPATPDAVTEELRPPLVGLSLLQGDILVARGLGPSIEPMHRVFSGLWSAIRPPLLGRDACPPRIWAT